MGLMKNTPSQSPSTPNKTRPEPHRGPAESRGLSGSRSPSDWLTSVAVEVPKARHAVKVSFKMPSTTVVAAR